MTLPSQCDILMKRKDEDLKMAKDEKKKFNQNEYINEYKKKHYSPLKINLKKEEKKELDMLLAEEGLTQAQFVRNAIAKLKAKKKKK